ncbi:hypothetical protein C8R43DRAFT_955641 [Mycena crocata]|nr:hypothetical protein C8R43DRAFT_955641 [Mycena crocata]
MPKAIKLRTRERSEPVGILSSSTIESKHSPKAQSTPCASLCGGTVLTASRFVNCESCRARNRSRRAKSIAGNAAQDLEEEVDTSVLGQDSSFAMEVDPSPGDAVARMCSIIADASLAIVSSHEEFSADEAFLRDLLSEISLNKTWFVFLRSTGITEAHLRTMARFTESRRSSVIAQLVPSMLPVDRVLLCDAIGWIA